MPTLYNRTAAVDYAHRWAFKRNPAYMDFHGIGGDCTNFVSQCLKAGGLPQNYTRYTGWYYNSPLDRAAAWTGVEYFYRFLTTNQGIGPKATVVPLEEIKPGDVIQLSFLPQTFGHTLIVVAVGSPATVQNVLIASHTFDSDNRPLSTYSYRAYRCLHIEA
ncbi:amidase domain-containing protein [Scatolibacter rhodanostii]|uniref:amidase domain-containing protein n=1 Tax=Scatolibacter rhodanostii TaxID=2014781 RepID=UPI000C0738F9|nr:amidase domain-containing protein [Scatolibacter rhodanostii]